MDFRYREEKGSTKITSSVTKHVSVSTIGLTSAGLHALQPAVAASCDRNIRRGLAIQQRLLPTLTRPLVLAVPWSVADANPLPVSSNFSPRSRNATQHFGVPGAPT